MKNLCKNPIHFERIVVVWRFFGPKMLKINQALLKLLMHAKAHFSSISFYRNLSFGKFSQKATLISAHCPCCSFRCCLIVVENLQFVSQSRMQGNYLRTVGSTRSYSATSVANTDPRCPNTCLGTLQTMTRAYLLFSGFELTVSAKYIHVH